MMTSLTYENHIIAKEKNILPVTDGELASQNGTSKNILVKMLGEKKFETLEGSSSFLTRSRIIRRQKESFSEGFNSSKYGGGRY